MPDPLSPQDPKEATEAKLCAYLEDELTPVERAEIEQHLSANPQHRQLLADLARTRDWMRQIPSETSPVDLAENFKAQVERAMLLDDSRERSSGLMMRWPQYALLAAVLLLMLGLGAVLVAMLKGPRPGQSKGLALAPESSAAMPATSDQLPEQQQMSFARTVDLAPPAIAPGSPQTPADAVAAVPAQTHAKLMNADGGSSAATAPLAVVPEPDAVDQIKARLLASGYSLPGDQRAVCFTVTSDSPAGSMDQLRQFFARHDLGFMETGSDSEPLAAHSQLVEQRSTQQSVVEGGSGGSGMQQKADAKQQEQKPQQNGTMAPVTTAPAAETGGGGLFVAKGLTPLQLELLSASLSADNLNQLVRRSTLLEGTKTLPADALARGQTLTITVAQLVGPGIDKTNLVKVADDGTIALPMIDPVPAAGASPSELQQRIADKYREANLIPQATVTVTTAVSPSTQTIAATQALATQPAAPASRPTGPAGINVVVLIQKPGAELHR